MEKVYKENSNDNFVQWQSLLEKRRKNIIASEASLKRHALSELSPEGTGEISRSRLHSADLATDTQEIETLESLSEKNIKAVQEVEAALDRLEVGKFGVCERCSEPIPINRLKAVPETRYCLECEQEIETMQQHTNPEKSHKVVPFPKSVVEFMSKLKVSDIMKDHPIVVRTNESLDSASNILAESKFRHLPVVDSDGNIQGILSDRDLLRLILRVRPWKMSKRVESGWHKNQVDSLMTKTPETVSPDTNMLDAGTILLENKISCLPVVEGNHLVGIITESDFVKVLCEIQQNSKSQ